MHPPKATEKDNLVLANLYNKIQRSVLAVVLHDSLILLDDALPVDDVLEQVHVPHACRGSPSGCTGRRNFQSVHHLVPLRRSSFRRPICCLLRPWVFHSGVHSRKVSNLSLTSCACRRGFMKEHFPGSSRGKEWRTLFAELDEDHFPIGEEVDGGARHVCPVHCPEQTT